MRDARGLDGLTLEDLMALGVLPRGVPPEVCVCVCILCLCMKGAYGGHVCVCTCVRLHKHVCACALASMCGGGTVCMHASSV